MRNGQIDIETSLSESLLVGDGLDHLQSLLLELTGEWGHLLLDGSNAIDLRKSGTLREAALAELSEPPSPFFLKLQEQYRQQGGPPMAQRDFCTLELWSVEKAVCVVVRADEWLMTRAAGTWTWANRISLQLTCCKQGASPVEAWAEAFFRRACLALRPAYGRTLTPDEFETKNMNLVGGRSAIGVNWAKAIPGIYWLNYFGPSIAKSLGVERLLKSPAQRVERHGDGVLLRLGECPFDWDSSQYKQTEGKVLDHLGRQHFFDRDNPDQPTAVLEDIARLIKESPAGPYDPSKPSVLRVHADSLE